MVIQPFSRTLKWVNTVWLQCVRRLPPTCSCAPAAIALLCFTLFGFRLQLAQAFVAVSPTTPLFPSTLSFRLPATCPGWKWSAFCRRLCGRRGWLVSPCSCICCFYACPYRIFSSCACCFTIFLLAAVTSLPSSVLVLDSKKCQLFGVTAAVPEILLTNGVLPHPWLLASASLGALTNFCTQLVTAKKTSTLANVAYCSF